MEIKQAILTPVLAIKARYIPLLLIYFAYGSSVFTAIVESFWVKNSLNLSAEALVALGVWLTVPWTIKMIFGQMVDSIPIFGSSRKAYVVIGALLLTIGILLMIGLIQESHLLSSFKKGNVYIFASVIMVVGYVIQDVVADTMSTEVVDRTRSQEEIEHELAMIQVLGRLSLGIAIFIVSGLGGWLADIYSYSTIYTISLFIPIISILGVIFIKLNPVESTPLNRPIFFGGFIFAVFVVFMGYNDIAYSQEIVFIISLIIILSMLKVLINDLDEKTKRHIVMAMIIIFVYRATPNVGPALQWWEIDVLKFDEPFFGTLSQIGAGIALLGMWISSRFIVQQAIGKVLIFLTIIGFFLSLPVIGMYYGLHTQLGLDAHTVALVDTAVSSPFSYISNVLMLALVAIYAPEGKRGTWFALMASLMNIALSASGLFTKYLNQIFVVTREVRENGVLTSVANYDNLGALLWIVTIIGTLIPLIVIWKFDPKKDKN
ncbi:putative membrane protein [Sulfurovum sp. enrichment culture clone C5]|uniref:Putative membrane protein n=1 Tax=Sulfurovum sp. enrichment culture clone C5 TaxID=497650 RepID=A0A0S4XMV2_9BACT|nr:putative membrane protein [Sulfurovum sp. enrichment culture clone C5]